MYKTVNEEISTLLMCVQTAKILLLFNQIGLGTTDILKTVKTYRFCHFTCFGSVEHRNFSCVKNYPVKKTRC